MGTPHSNAYKVVFHDGKSGQEMFNILWTGFCIAFTKMAAGYEQLKLCNKIGAKLQAISTENEGQPISLVMNRTLIATFVLLEPREWEKLKAMIKSDDVPWTHLVGQQVEDTIEALESSKQVEARLVETTIGVTSVSTSPPKPPTTASGHSVRQPVPSSRIDPHKLTLVPQHGE